MTFSPDGRLVLTTSDDRTARIWDTATGTTERVLLGHQARVYAGSFSPDGRRIVTSSEDRTVRLWDAEKAILIATIEGHRDVVNDASFSRDGRHVLTASNDKTARLWEAPDVLTLGSDDAWDWTRMIPLRPLTWEERREASLLVGAPDLQAGIAKTETAWLDHASSVDPAALKAAAERGSWGANLRLGELHERAGDSERALRAYAMAAERLDSELSKSETSDQLLRSYAERAFARRGALAQYFTLRGETAKVVATSREVQAWSRKFEE